MLTKKKIYLLLGILLFLIFPLNGGVFSDENVVHAQEEGGSISGMVYEANNGDTPETIAGVWVSACSTDDTFCSGTETNELGEYTITGLPSDKEYRVFIWGQPGWANEIYEETIWWDEATFVSVGATGIDFTLDPGGSISGLVTDVDGNPLANIGVDIMDGGYGTCTDEDGNYIIAGLPFGTYNIVAGRDFCEPHPYSEQITNDVVIDTETPDISGYDFALELGGSISGTVTDEYRNLIDNENVNVDISACLFDDDSVCWWASVQDDGSYAITGLPLGNYRVHAYQYPEGLWLDEYYKNTSVWEYAKPVKIKPGKNKKNIDFSLELGGSISGTVTAIGSGLIGDNIDVSACFEDDSFCGWASVQSDGTYVIIGLPAGEYRVHAYQWPEGYWIDEVYRETRDWDAYTPVTVTAGADTPDINFTLEYGGAITGVVGDGENGIEGIWVVAHDYSGDYFVSWAQTDATGTYRILGLPAGTYRVFINPQNGWTGQEYSPSPVTVTAGSDTYYIDFTLMPDSTISGTVTDVDGNHISERIDVAACLVADENACWWTTVQSNNSYTIIGLPSGEYNVNVYEVPGGNWIGETYPTTITVGVDDDIGGIDFKLEPETLL